MSSMVFNKRKAVFVHINKAEGSTVEKVLSPLEEQRYAKNLFRGLFAGQVLERKAGF